jgi:urease accessory protein
MAAVIRATSVVAASDFAGTATDSIVLDFDHRHRRRLQMNSESGKAFLLDLNEAVALHDRDVLELDDGSTVVVKAKAERVADITARDARHLTTIAWHLGNRHLATQILDGSLRIAYDHVIVEMLQGLGAEVSIVDAPFQPEGGAYGHTHGHGHD